MSTTPRTDAELFDPVHYSDQGGSSYGQMKRAADGDYVPAELARKLERELAEAKKDSARLDWLADVNTKTGWVMLSRPIIEANMHCMRAAIDAAMEVEK